MTMIHTKALKTHPPFDDTRSFRPFDFTQQRLSKRRSAPEGAPRRNERARVLRRAVLVVRHQAQMIDQLLPVCLRTFRVSSVCLKPQKDVEGRRALLPLKTRWLRPRGAGGKGASGPPQTRRAQPG
jgi:hypothetical protein